MIEYVKGDLFCSPAQVIVNTVNTVGVMGKGLALSFKKRYPDMFEAYRAACEKHQLTIGKLMLYYASDHWLLLFPTKISWRNPSRIEYLEEGLKKFVDTYAEKGITSIAFPKLGCGNGELSWSDVKPVMERYLKSLPIRIYIYVGTDTTQTPEHIAQQETIEWLKKNARDMSFNGVCDDLKHSCALLPCAFTCKGTAYTFDWHDQPSVTSSDGRKISFSTDGMFEAWDDIRNQGILALPEDDEPTALLYALLCSRGYLSPVRVLEPQDGGIREREGYQVNAGYSRAYALQG